MCGIFGVIGSHSDFSIRKSLDAIKHRGPDDKGELKDTNIHLGFRRLSIIDLSPRGHQPMPNEDKTVWIIFNGEIYNYQEIRKKLVQKHHFVSQTDTETLLHGYEEWGMKGLLERVNGMFGFCLYDKKKGEVYLVRDRIGKKPLYYFETKDYLAFASEVKAFFSLPSFRFSIDDEMFDLLIGFPYIPDNEKTLLQDVYKVPPGSYLTYSLHSQKKEIIQYWKLEKKDHPPSTFEETQNAVEKLLVDSIQKRLIADVPLAVLLSGGLDSSLITAIASKLRPEKIQTITISFADSSIDESKYAKVVSSHCNTNHTHLSLSIKNAYKTFKSHINIFDDLTTVDGGLFSTYLLSRAIRETGVKVVLVGEGADEVFGGYSWFQLSHLPFKLFPDAVTSRLYYYSIMRILRNKKSLIDYPNFLNRKLQEGTGSLFKKIQRYEILYSLPNHYCMKVDKGTMAGSIEARAPYLDYRLVEMAYSMKEQDLLNGRWYSPQKPNEKYILRSIARKYLPESIAMRKKKGGMLPTYDILNEGLKKDKGLILDNRYLNDTFSRDKLEKLIHSSPSNPLLKWEREWILWKSLIFALWYDYFSTYAKSARS